MIFTASDGILLHSESHPTGNARGAVLIVHGLGEHCGRYGELIKVLHRERFGVHLMDLRGHGRSRGVRGHVDSMEQFHSDLEEWIKFLEATDQLRRDEPLFLIGHSLGGLICLSFVARPRPIGMPKITGLALSSPAIGLHPSTIKQLQYLLAKKLPQMLKSTHVPNHIPAEHLSHDETVVNDYKLDPLVHSWITPGLFTAIIDEQKKLSTLRTRIHTPVLFLIPGEDKVVSAQAMEDYARRLHIVHPNLIEWEIFPDFFHEVFNETKKERAYLALRKWLHKCLSPSKKLVKKSASSKSSKNAATKKGTSRSRAANKVLST